MSELAQKSYSNLPTPIGSGGVVAPEALHSAAQSHRPANINLALAGSVMMPFLVFGAGTGSSALEEVYAPPMATGAWTPVVYYGAANSSPEADHAVWQRQLTTIKSGFQITMTDLARFLLVERPSVYQWFADAEPRQRNLTRISELADLASTWASLELGSLRAHLASRTEDHASSLEELIMQQPLPVDTIRRAFTIVANAASRQQATGRRSLSDRLVDQGFAPVNETTQARSRALVIPSTSPGEE